ncbi:RNA polymerase sigma factor [Streptomyces canus]|uniref:RNA polymerase sigma factor n=1 Tax=Streptomyces canus TaxID=58343 RepID=UPI0030DFD2B3
MSGRDGTRPESDDAAAAAVDRVFRTERTAVLATLIRQVGGDFQLAEDALQEAFAAALTAWRRDGVPDRAGAWITVAARRRAVDRLRRDRSLADRAPRLAELVRLDGQEHPPVTDDAVGALDDDRLRLIFTCCHPALDPNARVALTLRTVGGLTTREIARAFLVAEPTMGKRIVRAKRKIATAHIRYRIPVQTELPDRLRGVLRVIYLIFNEGYSAGDGDRLVRGELCGEAIRLGRLLTELLPGETEVWGLLALLLLNDARRAARVGADGGYVSLEDQDPALWEHDRIREGLRALRRATSPGPYQLQAAIAALHLQASAPTGVDWARIAQLYDALAQLAPSPVVAINHAASIAFADGPRAGLALLEPLLEDTRLAGYQPLHATHAELLRRDGDVRAAARAYERALELTSNALERTELLRRLHGLPGHVQNPGPAAT